MPQIDVKMPLINWYRDKMSEMPNNIPKFPGMSDLSRMNDKIQDWVMNRLDKNQIWNGDGGVVLSK